MAGSYEVTTVTVNGERLTSNPIPLTAAELDQIGKQPGSVQEIVLANIVKSLENQDNEVPGESTPSWLSLGDCVEKGEGVACTVNAKHVVSMEVKYTAEGP